MAPGGFLRLLDDKPVLLRLLASLTRQWLDTTHEFVTRLQTDIDVIRRDVLNVPHAGAVARIQGGLSDPHRGGRSVLWSNSTMASARTVQAQGPANRCCLAAARRTPECSALPSIFAWRTPLPVTATGGRSSSGTPDAEVDQRIRQFLPPRGRLARALALLRRRRYASGERHRRRRPARPCRPGNHASGCRAEPLGQRRREGLCAAREIISDSVMADRPPSRLRARPLVTPSSPSAVSLPTGRRKENSPGSTSTRMHEAVDQGRSRQADNESGTPRWPLCEPRRTSRRLRLGLRGIRALPDVADRDPAQGHLLDGFAAVPVRKVGTADAVLLHAAPPPQRRPHDGRRRSMVRSGRFPGPPCRLGPRPRPGWPLQRAERTALVELNVPFFAMQSEGTEITDTAGTVVPTSTKSGLQRARERMLRLDDRADRLAGRCDPAGRELCKSPASIDDQPRQTCRSSRSGPRRGRVRRRSRGDCRGDSRGGYPSGRYCRVDRPRTPGRFGRLPARRSRS